MDVYVASPAANRVITAAQVLPACRITPMSMDRRVLTPARALTSTLTAMIYTLAARPPTAAGMTPSWMITGNARATSPTTMAVFAAWPARRLALAARDLTEHQQLMDPLVDPMARMLRPAWIFTSTATI